MRRDESGAEWLTRCHPDPAQVWAEWDRQGVSMLPAGRLWDTVRLPQSLGLDVVDDLVRHDQLPEGAPLLAVPTRLYIFVPPGTATWWKEEGEDGTEAQGAGHWVSTVRPVADGPQTSWRTFHQWISPPDGSHHLVSPVYLREALHRLTTRHGKAPSAGCISEAGR